MLDILVVHANQDLFGNIQEALTPHFNVHSAPLEEQQVMPSEFRPADLMIVDFDLPEVLDTVHDIRNVEPNTDLLLLLPTQYQFKVVTALFRYNVSDCFMKPFAAPDLINAVCKVKAIPNPTLNADSSSGSGATTEAEDSTESQSEGDDPSTNDIASYLLDQTNLPMMPPVAMRIVRLCRQANVNAEQIEKIIGSDQSFAAELLKTANSALYKRAVAVRSIQAAIVRVGLKNVNNLAIGLSAKALHKIPTPRSQMLWQRSRTIASAAQVVAVAFHMHEDTYVAGLLHNVGMTLLNNLDAERFESCMELQTDGMDPIAAETEVFGIAHTTLGKALVKKWNIDPVFAEALEAYPNPWDFNLSKEGNIIASCIHLAQVMMQLPLFTQMGEDEFDDEQRSQVVQDLCSERIVEHLKLSKGQLEAILKKLEMIFIQDRTA